MMPNKQRSIERDVQSFCGWDFLLELIKACPDMEHKGVIAGLFLTGCRVSELIRLRLDNVSFEYLPKLLLFKDVPVLKRYSRKTGKRYVDYRTFPVKYDEPLVPFFVDYYKYMERRGEKLLYPYHRSTIFRMVRTVGYLVNRRVPFSNIHSSQLYPHWFRAQRASQLKIDYGFDLDALREFFGWKMRNVGVPVIYAKVGWIGLARKMGIDI